MNIDGSIEGGIDGGIEGGSDGDIEGGRRVRSGLQEMLISDSMGMA